ncbi:FecCD family ABC transporter permease [Butyrivibrio sp. NC3005]|uniref:FecCD family ABC transporter permease n=1 Tax=Butyrivibrio sp. NC3005 TaxID=1280685 RepID=UPI0004132931|nr:iron ABC transporter permease [Butyrivibrio sp. NC3005]
MRNEENTKYLKNKSMINRSRNMILACFVILFTIFSVALCIGIGSVNVNVGDVLTIIGCKVMGIDIPHSIDSSLVSILWTIRMPRVFMAFCVGGALALSGAVMQAVLQNPLASSYTLGVSSGACLGAAIIIVTEFTIKALGYFLLPTFGFIFGFVTVLAVLAFSVKIDSNLHSHTVILMGMVVSLFVNALLTLVSAFAGEHSQKLLMWQMGSFSGRRWYHVEVLFPICIICLIVLVLLSSSLDVLSFGDEAAYSIGVDVKKCKKILFLTASLLTGVSVCFSGTIGFVDLIVAHIVRRIFGSSHRIVLPMTFFLGGSFMAICDMVARTLLSPRELPVGAVTALIGAPFFIWIYLRGRNNNRNIRK